MIENKKLYDLDDLTIIPNKLTKIEHRKDCFCYLNNTLPLFTAPMNCVINENNIEKFESLGINVIIPQGVSLEQRLKLCKTYFIAVNLSELENEILTLNLENGEQIKICVDVANGHMQRLLNLCNKVKTKFGKQILLMAGNIANPNTYLEYAKVGIDFVRVSIGNGGACLTSVQTGVNYPMGSLLDDTYKMKLKLLVNKEEYKSVPYIVADGGFNSFSRIIKALALGADYVMCGKVFAQSKEACGETMRLGDKIYRAYYGMSTKRAQKELGKKKLHTSEGIEGKVEVLYNLSSWIENFIDYLQSAMSYCNAYDLNEFKKTTLCPISSHTRLSYIK